MRDLIAYGWLLQCLKYEVVNELLVSTLKAIIRGEVNVQSCYCISIVDHKKALCGFSKQIESLLCSNIIFLFILFFTNSGQLTNHRLGNQFPTFNKISFKIVVGQY